MKQYRSDTSCVGFSSAQCVVKVQTEKADIKLEANHRFAEKAHMVSSVMSEKELVV